MANTKITTSVIADGAITSAKLDTDISVSGTVTADGLTVASDTDVTVDIGRAKIGNVGFSDFAGFAHRDNATTANYALLQYNTGETYLNAASGRDINFRINNSNVGMFTSDGDLLISATSSSINAGSISLEAQGRIRAGRDGGAVMQLNRTTSDGDIAVFYKDGSPVASIGAYGGASYIGGNLNGSIYFNGNTDVRPFDKTSLANYDNQLNLGGTTSRWKDLYLSGGAYLGGTGSANHLDDYEEGTWTPSISFSGGTTGQSYVRQQGIYIKIGKMVYVQGHLYFSNKGSSTGHATLTGLPFAISPVASGAFTPIGDRGNLNTGGEPVNIYLHSGGTTATLYHSGFDGGSNNDVTNAQFNNSTEIDVNFVYRAA